MKSFYVIYLDDDKKEWNYISNCFDDTEVTHRTVELQKSGRNVRICTPETLEPPQNYVWNKELYW